MSEKLPGIWLGVGRGCWRFSLCRRLKVKEIFTSKGFSLARAQVHKPYRHIGTVLGSRLYSEEQDRIPVPEAFIV